MAVDTYHHKSIEAARESANRQGVADGVTFEVAKARAWIPIEMGPITLQCLPPTGDLWRRVQAKLPSYLHG
jgi:hypothetical protein